MIRSSIYEVEITTGTLIWMDVSLSGLMWPDFHFQP